MNFKSKKGEGTIGETITWMIAFVIIVFILLVYLAFVGVLSAKKYVPLIGSGSNQINIITSPENLELQRKLFYFFDYEVEKGKTIKDLFYSWALTKDSVVKEQISTIAKVVLEDKENNCYLLLTEETIFYSSDGLFDISENSKVNSAKIILTSGDKEVNIQVYSSKC